MEDLTVKTVELAPVIRGLNGHKDLKPEVVVRHLEDLFNLSLGVRQIHESWWMMEVEMANAVFVQLAFSYWVPN